MKAKVALFSASLLVPALLIGGAVAGFSQADDQINPAPSPVIASQSPAPTPENVPEPTSAPVAAPTPTTVTERLDNHEGRIQHLEATPQTIMVVVTPEPSVTPTPTPTPVCYERISGNNRTLCN